MDLSLFKDESQLQKRKRGSSSKQKRLRKKSKKSTESSEESESESDESEDEEAIPEKKKASPAAKKRSNKTIAIAKSVVKGPSRAERAMNRGAKSSESVNNVSKNEKKPEPKKVSKAQNNGAGASRATKVRG